MKWKPGRDWLLLIIFSFKQWKANTRFWIVKRILDFAELRRMEAQSVGEKRVLYYGDRSWEWRWIFWQERLWGKVGNFALRKL